MLDVETALGDRTNLVFQNTQVTRGTAAVVVTATGSATEMGRIADMVTATQRQRSPLQQELDGMTKVFGVVAWLAVAVIAIFGIARGQSFDTVVLLCISTAIASIPVGLPTFVQAMLSSGAQRLAESKAVVKSLADVETLGGTTVINSDKTGTLTLNQMTATTMLAGGDWFRVEGGGYRKSGAILGVAGSELPDFRRVALGLTLCSDATVADDESIIGDPTEAALVVLAAKMSTDAERTRNSLQRRAEVPFDSEYKFMATFHDRPDWLAGGILKERHFMTVKGAPDVVVGLCSHALWHGQEIPIDEVRKEILDANQQLSEKGLRVLSFAARDLDDQAMSAAIDRADGGRARPHPRRAGRHHRPAPLRGRGRRPRRAPCGHRCPHDHRRPYRHRPRDRRRARPRPRRSDRDRAAASPRRRGRTPAPRPACVRPRRAGGQAEARQADAAVGRCRGDDRRRRERRRGPQAGRHRGRDGKRLRSLQAGRQDRPDRRQLRDARTSGRPRPRHLPQDHLLREAPADDPVLRAAADGAGHDLQHQRRRGAVPDAAAVLQVLRRRNGGRSGSSSTSPTRA